MNSDRVHPLERPAHDGQVAQGLGQDISSIIGDHTIRLAMPGQYTMYNAAMGYPMK